MSGASAYQFRGVSANAVGFAPAPTDGSSTLGPLQQLTRTVPIVFAAVADPVGGGFVESLARPGGNITGFELFEYSIGGKWLEHLKQIAQRVTRVAVLRDAALVSGGGQAADPLAVRIRPPFGECAKAATARSISSASRMLTGLNCTPNDGATDWIAPYCGG
jgi:putative ABC transport system substrate-binding protein